MKNTNIHCIDHATQFSCKTEDLYENLDNKELLSNKNDLETDNIIIIDSRNFKVLYNLYYYDLCRFLNLYTQETCVIEEIIQDLFISLWENRDKIEIKYIKTYLYKGARNKMLNHLRDNSNRKTLLIQWAKSIYENRDTNDCIDREKFFITLKDAMKNLPEKCREIFILSREYKLSYKEISQIKNVSLKTVENQMVIAFKKIKYYFSIHFHERA